MVANKKSQPAWRTVVESASFGFVLGALFPLVSTVLALVSADLIPSIEATVHLHASEPLLQVIDTMPLVLAVAFALVGRNRAQLDELIAGLEGRVVQRTAVLTATEQAKEQDDRRRSLLLARVSRAMCERIDTIVSTPIRERSPWAWEPVKDIAKRLLELSSIEAGRIPSETEVIPTTELAEKVRSVTSDWQMIQSNVICTVDPGCPESIETDTRLVSATLELATQLTAGLASGGTTTVELLPEDGAHGSADRLHVRCRNDKARGSCKNLRTILAGGPVPEDTDAARELVGLTLRTYAEALGAELAVRSSTDEGTTVSVVIPVVAITSPVSEARAELVEAKAS